MTKQLKYIILLSTLLLFFLCYFIFFQTNSHSFSKSYKDAHKHSQNIQAEIEKSELLITKTKKQLDSIDKKLSDLRIAQQQSNSSVSTNNKELQGNLLDEERKLEELTNMYSSIQKNKQELTLQLDSLARVIQNEL